MMIQEGYLGSMKTCDGTLSAICRIPMDVLGEIFLHCVASQDRNPALSFAEAPLLLTGICTSWRTLALSFPQLWASVHILISCELDYNHTNHDIEARRRHYSATMAARCKLLTEWLSRSGSQKLSVSIVLPDVSSRLHFKDCEDVAVDSLFRTLLPSANRWSELNVVMPMNLFEKRLDTAIPVEWEPILQKLTLSLGGVYPPGRGPFTLLNAPTLQKLTYSGPGGRFYSLLSSPPKWNRLSSFTCHDQICAKEALLLLQHCPCLVDCRITIAVSRHNTSPTLWTSSASTSAVFLKSLHIRDSETIENSTALFNALDAPNLKWFLYERFIDSFYVRASAHCPPLSLLERSNVLTKFTLDPCEIPSNLARNFLQAARNITNFVLAVSKDRYNSPVLSYRARPSFDLDLLTPGRPDSSSEILWPGCSISQQAGSGL